MENDFCVSSQRLCLEVKSGSIIFEPGPIIHRSGERMLQAEKIANKSFVAEQTWNFWGTNERQEYSGFSSDSINLSPITNERQDCWTLMKGSGREMSYKRSKRQTGTVKSWRSYTWKIPKTVKWLSSLKS